MKVHSNPLFYAAKCSGGEKSYLVLINFCCCILKACFVKTCQHGPKRIFCYSVPSTLEVLNKILVLVTNQLVEKRKSIIVLNLEKAWKIRIPVYKLKAYTISG